MKMKMKMKKVLLRWGEAVNPGLFVTERWALMQKCVADNVFANF